MSDKMALKIAIDLMHVPSQVRLVRSEPLPDGVLICCVLRREMPRPNASGRFRSIARRRSCAKPRLSSSNRYCSRPIPTAIACLVRRRRRPPPSCGATSGCCCGGCTRTSIRRVRVRSSPAGSPPPGTISRRRNAAPLMTRRSGTAETAADHRPGEGTPRPGDGAKAGRLPAAAPMAPATAGEAAACRRGTKAAFGAAPCRCCSTCRRNDLPNPCESKDLEKRRRGANRSRG